MAERRDLLILLAAGVAAAGAGFAFGPSLSGFLHPADREGLRAARFKDLSGKERALSEWQGKVLIINFWATWCPPCREEIPAFMRTREKLHASGVEVVGIAIDNAAKVAQYALEVKISYPLLLADAGGLDLMRRLGNPSGGLPFTLVLDRKGDIVERNLGAVTQKKIEAQLAPLLSG